MAFRREAPLKEVYLDTSALIAVRDRRDKHHAAAARTLRSLVKDRARLVMGYHTVVEYLDGVGQFHDQARAVEELAWLTSSPSVRIIPSDELREPAEDILRTRTGWSVSLSDCLSFALMQAVGIDTAFTYDSDFEKAGFTRIG